jgi:hypothetical protein
MARHLAQNVNMPCEFPLNLSYQFAVMLRMTLPTAFSDWNLDGHDAHDRSRNIISPSDWYGFQAQQSAKTEQEQGTHGSDAAQMIFKGDKGTGRSERSGKK